MSSIYDFVIDLASDNSDWDLDSGLLSDCTLRIRHQGGERLISGVIRSFERTSENGRTTHYRAVLVPLHWQLSKLHRSRIFQAHNCPDMSVPGIIRKVLQDGLIPPDAYRFALTDSHFARDYVVQYRESDLDFMSRLMEEEGIYYFFEHDESGHRMVIADGLAAHSLAIDAQEYPYRERDRLGHDREFVYSLRDSRRVEMGSASLDDFDFRRPGMELRQIQKSKVRPALEFSDYPGGYTDKVVGARLAQVRLDERQCRRRTLKLRATARGLRPGYLFTLVEHPNPELNSGYLITSVEHRGCEPQNVETGGVHTNEPAYEARVRAIPDLVVYRPARRTPRAMIRGSQTAIVVGPDQNEIHTDVYGRVKVQFHWDTDGLYDEHSSCWIRVSQGMAGGQIGMMFLPRVGHEVIVDFLEGDPDKPIITGRVYNNANMPPYKLPEEKTKSTIKTNATPDSQRYHEIRFEDAHKQEQLFIRAQRRMDTRVTGPHFHTTGGSLHELIGNTDANGGKRGSHLRTARANSEVHTGVDHFEYVESRRFTTVEQPVYDAFNAEYYLLVRNLIGANADRLILEMNSSIVLKVDDENYIEITRDGIKIRGTRVDINCEGKPPAGLIVPPPPDADIPANEKDTENKAWTARPLDASPADDGRPTRGRRGSGNSKPRARQWVAVPIQRTPARTLIEESTGCEIKSITATCSHGRSIASPGQVVLQVVPSGDILADEIELATRAKNCCDQHPEWSVDGKVQARGARAIRVPATADPAYSHPSRSAWLPDAKSTEFKVACKGCAGGVEMVRIEAFPARKLDLQLDALSSPSLAAELAAFHKRVKKAVFEDLNGKSLYPQLDDFNMMHFMPGARLGGAVRATAGWREHSDHRVFYAYDIAFDVTVLAVHQDNVINVGPVQIKGSFEEFELNANFRLAKSFSRGTPAEPLKQRSVEHIGTLTFEQEVSSPIPKIVGVDVATDWEAAYHMEAEVVIGVGGFGVTFALFRDSYRGPLGSKGPAQLLKQHFKLYEAQP